MKTPKTIVILADASKARVFSLGEKRGQAGRTEPGLTEKLSLVHPEKRIRSSELMTETRPSTRKGPGSHAHAVDDHRDAYDDASDERFAKDVIANVKKFRTEYDAVRIIVLSSPRFLGHIKQHWGTCAIESVFLPLNISGLSESEALSHLQSNGYL